jgi:hypothetical protein
VTETVAVPKALLERLLDRVDDLEAELSEYRAENERDKATIRQQVADAAESERSETVNEDGDDRDDLLPIERLMEMGKRGITADVTASVRRARSIAEHFGQWAAKTPNGHVIKENLKTLLETATGERLAWKQVYRACRALERFTRGLIEFKKHRRYGWMLVGDASVVKKLDRHVSSATGG